MIVLTALRSIAFSIAFYSGSLLIVLAAMAANLVSRAWILPLARLWSGYHRACARWLLGQKVRIVGDLPHGPYLYIVKHESMFETIDLLTVLRRPAIAAKAELFNIPLWGGIAKGYGLIPIERNAGASAMRTLRTAARDAIAQGRPICLFPEGTRVPHGESPPLRAGFAGLYGLLKLPVVPIAIDSGRVSPRGKFLKSAGTITYKVGEIIPAGLDRHEAEALVHSAINALNREPVEA